jgi:hypothetical protein
MPVCLAWASFLGFSFLALFLGIFMYGWFFGLTKALSMQRSGSKPKWSRSVRMVLGDHAMPAASECLVIDAKLELEHARAAPFQDPGIPIDFGPFNVQNLDGKLYVTFARRSEHDGSISEKGSGFVNVFDTEGTFIRRLISGEPLNKPWGLALAPSGFGKFSNGLLVGNHGNGRINAFDPKSGRFVGALRDQNGRPLQIKGLLGLAFGNVGNLGDSNVLHFAAGPTTGHRGLLGSIRLAACNCHAHQTNDDCFQIRIHDNSETRHESPVLMAALLANTQPSFWSVGPICKRDSSETGNCTGPTWLESNEIRTSFSLADDLNLRTWENSINLWTWPCT